MLVRADGVAAYLADRASGFLVAFSPSGEYAYARAYHVFHYALLVAVPLVALSAGRPLRPERRDRIWSWVRSPSGPAWIFLALLAVGGFLSIHSVHKVYAQEWNFATRQALTCVFLFFLALVYLVRSPVRMVAVLGLCLALAGSLIGFVSLGREVERLKEADPEAVGRQPWKPEVAEWLMERRSEQGELTVAISYTWPQRLALSTPGVNYHWAYWKTTREDVVRMFRKLGVRYLLWERHSRPKPDFLRPKAEFVADFEEIEKDLHGFRVFVLRDSRSTGREPSERHGAASKEARR
jgi:hypothetical protein